LIPYARNARTHSDEQIKQIAASIREFGFTNPVLVDEQGSLICGHGRVLAAQLLGITDVPTMVARGWTHAQIQAYRLTDNQLALNAGRLRGTALARRTRHLQLCRGSREDGVAVDHRLPDCSDLLALDRNSCRRNRALGGRGHLAVPASGDISERRAHTYSARTGAEEAEQLGRDKRELSRARYDLSRRG
jgi:hypothetical protein